MPTDKRFTERFLLPNTKAQGAGAWEEVFIRPNVPVFILVSSMCRMTAKAMRTRKIRRRNRKTVKTAQAELLKAPVLKRPTLRF